MNKERISEIIRYGLIGLTTTVINIALYHGLVLVGIDYRISNFIALISAKVYGYVANKKFVFRTHCETKKELIYEILRYVFARGVTGIFDFFGLIISVEVLKLDKVVSKYVIQTIVIILNYLMGKFVIFRKRNRDEKYNVS